MPHKKMFALQGILSVVISNVSSPVQFIEKLVQNTGPILIAQDLDFSLVDFCTVPAFSHVIYGQHHKINAVHLRCGAFFGIFSGQIYDLFFQVGFRGRESQQSECFFATNLSNAVFRNVHFNLTVDVIPNALGNTQFFAQFTTSSRFESVYINVSYPQTEGFDVELWICEWLVDSVFTEVEIEVNAKVKSEFSALFLYKTTDNLILTKSLVYCSNFGTFNPLASPKSITVSDFFTRSINVSKVFQIGNFAGQPKEILKYLASCSGCTFVKNNFLLSTFGSNALNCDSALTSCKNYDETPGNLSEFLAATLNIRWNINFDNSISFLQFGSSPEYSTPRIQVLKPAVLYPYHGQSFDLKCSENCYFNGDCLVGDGVFACSCRVGYSKSDSCMKSKMTNDAISLLFFMLIFVLGFIAVIVLMFYYRAKWMDLVEPLEDEPETDVVDNKQKLVKFDKTGKVLPAMESTVAESNRPNSKLSALSHKSKKDVNDGRTSKLSEYV